MSGAEFLLIGALLSAPPDAAKESTPVEVRAAVTRSVGYLEARGVHWMEQFKCASCHHVPMMLWSLDAASRRGIPVNRQTLERVRNWALDLGNAAKVFPPASKDGAPPSRFQLVTAYMAIANATDSTNNTAKQAQQRFVEYLQKSQRSDGYWEVPGGRRPILGTSQLATGLALVALARSQPYSASLRSGMDRARTFLNRPTEKPGTQELAARILVAAQLADRDAGVRYSTELRAMQNRDGGWSQEVGLESDAYATGEALFALARMDPAPNANVRRAWRFLVATQNADGSWPMKSRPFGPTNKPSTNLEPIQYAGTAWAVLGLVQSLPR